MEYPIRELARLSGVSTRTLRYYDQLGLLRPLRAGPGGCRVYGGAEAERLQQILFYRELGVPLAEIGRLLDAPGYDPEAALRAHLEALLAEKTRLEALIGNVKKTIGAMKGAWTMTDTERFEGFRAELLANEEAAYGAEARRLYKDEAVDASRAKLAGMTQEDWARAEALRTEYETLLKTAAARGEPAGADAQRACALHGQWLRLFWKDGTCTKQAQLGLGELYVCDERFRAYYDRLAPGCAVFFRDALRVWCA